VSEWNLTKTVFITLKTVPQVFKADQPQNAFELIGNIFANI